MNESEQKDTEIALLRARIEVVEKERSNFRKMAERYKQRNHAMLDIINRMSPKKEVKIEPSSN